MPGQQTPFGAIAETLREQLLLNKQMVASIEALRRRVDDLTSEVADLRVVIEDSAQEKGEPKPEAGKNPSQP